MAGTPSSSEPPQSGGRRGGRPPNPGTKWWDDLRDIDVSRLEDSPSAAWDTGRTDIPGWETPPDSAAGHIWGRGRARSADPAEEYGHGGPSGGPPEPASPREPPREPPREQPRHGQPRHGAPPPEPPYEPPYQPSPPEPPRYQPPPEPYQPAEPPRRRGRRARRADQRAPEPEAYQPPAEDAGRRRPGPGGPQIPGWGASPSGGGDSTAEFPAMSPPAAPPPPPSSPPRPPPSAPGPARPEPQTAQRPPDDAGRRRRRRAGPPPAADPPGPPRQTGAPGRGAAPPPKSAGPRRPPAADTPTGDLPRVGARRPDRAGRRAGRVDPAAIAAFSNTRSGFAALLAGGLAILLIFGSRLDQAPYAVICFAVQAIFVAAWTLGGKPPGARVVAGIGILAALGADLVVVYSSEASLAPLGYVAAAAFVLGVVGQLLRGGGRARATESIGAMAVVTVAVVALATPILLSRYPAGGEALLACLLATGVALVVARVSDMVLHQPRVSPQVPRGAPGVVLGAMCGTAVAGFAGWVLDGLTPGVAVIAGVVVAVAAVLADLGMVFAETGRLLAGENPARWMVRAMLGPLVAFAVAAPAAYLLSVLMIVKGF